jgi:hypothetical protein
LSDAPATFPGDAPPALSQEQQRALDALLNLIIPASTDGRLPGAVEVGFLDHARQERILPWLRDGLQLILAEARLDPGADFAALGPPQQTEVIGRLRRQHFRFFGDLTTRVLQCYYQNDRVLAAIGIEPRPPFPHGYALDDGDFTLLEPVFERGRIYRDPPEG